jgi:hypothetical protein
MRRVWDREMRALADAKPVKEWIYKGEEPALGF